MQKLRTQVASDIDRDGLGIELIDPSDQVIAEIFRSDRDKTLIISTFGNDVPLEAILGLIARARRDLNPFEDGSPLLDAVPSGWNLDLPR